MNKTIRIIGLLTFIFLINSFSLAYTPEDFDLWLKDFKNSAVKKGISKKTVDSAMKNTKFLPKVIEYDRYQPEFYEDTFTYISKRTSKNKINKGINLYNNKTN